MRGDIVKWKRERWLKPSLCKILLGTFGTIIAFGTFYLNSKALYKITAHEQRVLEQQSNANSNNDIDGIDKSMIQLKMNSNGLIATTKKTKSTIKKGKAIIKQQQQKQQQQPIVDDSVVVDYFANNGYAKAFDTMQYPMGLYDSTTQKTFISYQGPHEDPYIISYHHPSATWDGPYRIGVSELGHEDGDPVQMHDGRKFAHGEVAIDPNTNRMAKTRKFQADNHGKPSIVIDTNGYIHISYGAHGGDIGNRKRLGINHYGDYSGGRQFHMKSKHPYKISSGFEIQNIGKSVYNGGRGRYTTLVKHSRLSWNGCYAQFVQVPLLDKKNQAIQLRQQQLHQSDDDESSSAIYHFVRHGAHVSCWTYQVSTNNGRTFGPVIPIVKTKQQTDASVKDSWYCRFRGGADSIRSANQYSHLILATCVYHNHWMPPNTHTLEAHNAYYMYLDTRTGIWYNVQGEVLMSFPEPENDHYEITVDSLYYSENISFPSKLYSNETKLSKMMGLTKEMVDAKALVLDTEHSNMFHYNYLHPGSVAIDENGNPHMLLKIAVDGEMDGLKIGRGRKRMYYVKWTGTKWTDPVAITEHYFDYNDNNNQLQVETDEDGDIMIENSNNITIIFPINNITHADISTWNSIDGGISWQKGKSLYILQQDKVKLKISALIRNGHDNAQIVAYNLDGTKKNDPYRKLYLFGSNGAISRQQNHADICYVYKVSDTAVKCINNNNHGYGKTMSRSKFTTKAKSTLS